MEWTARLPSRPRAALLVLALAGCGDSPPAAGPTRATQPAAAVETPVALAPPVLSEPKTHLEAIARGYGDGRSDREVRTDNELIQAVGQGDVALAKAHLEAGARVSARYIDETAFLSAGQSGYTALLLASIDGNAEMVKLLLTYKPELDYARRGKTALEQAAIRDHQEVVALLQAAGAAGDPKKLRLVRELIRAASRGFEMEDGEGFPPYPGAPNTQGALSIDEVLRQGANVNWADGEGHTPLMYAANLGLVENVRTLLARGADANLATKEGDTALSLVEGESSVNQAERAEIAEILKTHLAARR